ncbi:hypothetical protein H4S07_001339 [Coemansia furcata]|uniref:Uncharacterized protein n=1 Tax=Coemansia furcata TaxID=417177 RepID=A0ACC1LMM9_9FUNG|nr:hypothetical protein H4S07_001339 [Coemansia furcata]
MTMPDPDVAEEEHVSPPVEVVEKPVTAVEGPIDEPAAVGGPIEEPIAVGGPIDKPSAIPDLAAPQIESEASSSAPSAPPLPSRPSYERRLHRTSSSSSTSKVHDAIQDIINQFDPLRVASSTQLDAGMSPSTASLSLPAQMQDEEERRRHAELKAKFEPAVDSFNYNDFLVQLRNPAAKPVARTVKTFLTEFGRRPMTLTEQVRFVHDFLDFIADKMRQNDVWRDADDREFENAREGIEKLVMNRLYPLCFSPATSDDADKDHVLREKTSLFRWIAEDHLDIPKSPQNAAFLHFAKSELLKINNFKSPRDKVICILNCCTVIYGLLRNMRPKGSRLSAASTEDVGADKFLPLLIYVVITASPPKLVSNIQYICRFRSPERMQSEAGYYVTNLQGAIAFIESMDASCLSITQEEFNKNIEMTIWEIELEKRGKERSQQQQQQQQVAAAARRQVIPDLSGERAQWLLGRSSDLAKSTLEKTNNFVGRLFSELSTPTAASSESGQSTPRRDGPGYPGPAASQIQRTSHNQADDSDSDYPQGLVVGGPEWGATLAMVRDMFPNVDREVVDIVFESNAGSIPHSIEQLLDISMGDEVINAVEPRAPGASQRDVADDDAEDDVERWKDNWADEDDDDDEGAYNALDAGITPMNLVHGPFVAGAAATRVNDDEEPRAGGLPTAVPDTSGDEELARKLQEEFERQE